MKLKPIDESEYVKRIQEGPCFICEFLRGNPNYKHHVVGENEITIAFLNKHPTQLGYTLVAPKDHREHLTGDFSKREYLEIQEFIFEVSEAIRIELDAERMYVLSLGSKQGNSHTHWHIAPLPRGVPYEKQQFEALMWSDGVLELSEADLEELALRLRKRLERS